MMKDFLLTVSVLRRFLPLLNKRPLGVLAALSVSLASALSAVALMTLGAWILAKAAFMVSIAEIQTAVVGVRFFGLSRAVFRYLERLLSHKVSFSVMLHLRDRLFRSAEAGFPASFQGTHSGQTLKEYVRDSEAAEKLFIQAVLPLITALSAASVFLLFTYRPLMDSSAFLSFCLFTLINLLLLPLFYLRSGSRDSRNLADLEFRSSRSAMDFAVAGHDLQRLDRDGLFSESYLNNSAASSRVRRSMEIRERTMHSLQLFLATAAVIIILQQLQAAGPLTDDLRIFAVAAIIGWFALQEVFIQVSTAAAWAGVHIRSLWPLLGRISQVPESTAHQSSPGGPGGPAVHEYNVFSPDRSARSPERYWTDESLFLAAENLSYRIPGADHDLLQGVSLQLRRDERILLSAPNGSGKTTLAYIAAGLLNYQGSLILQGREISRISRKEMAAAVSFMPQQPLFLRSTLLEALYPKQRTAVENGVLSPARRRSVHDSASHSHDFSQLSLTGTGLTEEAELLLEELRLLQLPLVRRGLAQSVDWLRCGLSGGELQRLALARSLLHPAALLILDEPLRNIEPEFAESLMHLIQRYSQGRSLLLISHTVPDSRAFHRSFTLSEGRLTVRSSSPQP